MQFQADHCVVSISMRPGVLTNVRATHMGVESTMRRVTRFVFWSALKGQVRNVLSRCDKCQAAGRPARAQPKEPLTSHAIRDRQIAVLGTDRFSLRAISFLILVYYWSGFWEPDVLIAHNRQQTQFVFGDTLHNTNTKRLILDNGPHFHAATFSSLQDCGSLSTSHLALTIQHPMLRQRVPQTAA